MTVTENEDLFGTGITALAAAPPGDWISGVKEAFASFHQVEAEGCRVPIGPARVLKAGLDIVNACCRRPMPAAYRKFMPAVEVFAAKLIERYEFLASFDLCPLEINLNGLQIDMLEERLAAADRPKLRDDPNKDLQLPGMTDSQLLKMYPHLTIEQILAARADRFNRLPEVPVAEQPPINSVSSSLRDALDRLSAVADICDEVETGRAIEREEQIVDEAIGRIRVLEARRSRLSGAK